MATDRIIDFAIQVAGVETLETVLANFSEFVERRNFERDRLAYHRTLNACLAEVYGDAYARRCRECNKWFDRTPRIDNTLFCVDCLNRFDGGSL